MRKGLVILLLSVLPIKAAQESWRAITIVPVANLAFQRLAPLYPNKNVLACYQKMTLEGTKVSARSCLRAHQLLFNEQVDIIDRSGDEVLVKIPQCYYSTADAKNVKNNEYWSHKSNFLPLSRLKEQGLDTQLIPAALSFEEKTLEKANDSVVTLLLPFEDNESHRLFSAGTRFVMAKPADKKDAVVVVWAFDPASFTMGKLFIPKNLCITHYPETSERMRTAFVQLLRIWAQEESESFIPYVWGGCSFTTLYNANMICSPADINPKIPSSFSLNNKKILATGLDCSGAILRATQILNIPYFFKNSLTALKSLNHITQYKNLAIGDLMYIQGHLMVVADLKNNSLLEARSHYHGFGRLHEIKLSDEFKGIETYQQLLAAINKGIPLERLDANHKVIAQITDAQLLKLPI